MYICIYVYYYDTGASTPNSILGASGGASGGPAWGKCGASAATRFWRCQSDPLTK